MEKSGWRISKADPEDAEELLRFLNRVGGESDNLLFGAGEMKLTVEQEREWIIRENSQSQSVTLIGKLNGEIAAIGSLAGFNRERIAHRAELSVVVSRECWGQGIGRSMMEALISFGRDSGREILELKVRTDNERAIRLYESLGFQACGTYSRFFKIGGTYYDALLMNLSL